MIRTLIYLCFAVTATFAADCVWNKDTDYPAEDPPVILDMDSWLTVLPVYENDERLVRVSEGTVLVLSCPESDIAALGVVTAEATCVGDQSVLVNGQEYPLSALGCSSSPKETLFKKVDSCGEGGELTNIGFDIVGYHPYYLIRVCFEPVAQTTLFTDHVLRGAHISAKDISSSRPSFKSDTGFFTVSANTVYTQDSQTQLMADILGDSSVIDTSQSFYFARGHLSPDADFATEQEQDATYYYINAVPQWQSFNNGNWKYLEYSARNLAELRATDITIWTGGHGVLQLDDVNNNPVDIYLGLAENEEVIPAPAVTWKVVFDVATNEAAAVVGVNNPYLTSTPTPLCGSESFCSSFTWLEGLDLTDYEAGPMYCCTYQDLKAAIPSVPDVGDPGLLTDI